MSWAKGSAGAYLDVVADLKAFKAESDVVAEESGHVEVVRQAAFVIMDSKKGIDAHFSVSISGHSSTKKSFQGTASVTVTQNTPEEG